MLKISKLSPALAVRVPPVEFAATLTPLLKNGFLFPGGIFQAQEELMLSLSGTHV